MIKTPLNAFDSDCEPFDRLLGPDMQDFPECVGIDPRPERLRNAHLTRTTINGEVCYEIPDHLLPDGFKERLARGDWS